jgi:hypothetical protein
MEQADGSPALEEANGHPLPSPRLPRLGLFRSHDQSPLEEETWETPAGEQLADDGSPSASEWPSDGSEPESDDPTSSPSTSADPGASVLSKKALKATFRQGVLIGSGVAHRVAARTEGQQRVGLYLADQEDAEAIADPLASIASRRGGIVGKVSPDTADFIQSLMGVAGFMSKQIANLQAAREYDAQAAGHAPLGGPVDV